MKKLLPFLLSAALLTGCGATTEQESITTEEQDEVKEEIADEAVSEAAVEEETAAVQKQYSSDELQRIGLDITYHADASTEEMFFEYTKDGYDYFSCDLTGNGGQKCGIHETVHGQGRYELYFSGEIAERTDAMFSDFYKTSIEAYQDVIDDTFMELAQKSADEKIDPMGPKLRDDTIRDKMPDNLSLVIDGNTLELDVVKVEVSGNRCAKTETEPENATVPCWVDDNGNYRYLDHIIVYFYVPIEQVSPLYAFFDAAEEEQQKLVDSGAVEAEEENNAESEAEEDDHAESEAEQASGSGNQTIPESDLIGTWYDPTGYNTVAFTFYGDGTGIINWGDSTDNLTYSLSGNTINILLPNNVNDTITVGVNCLYFGGSKFVKK